MELKTRLSQPVEHVGDDRESSEHGHRVRVSPRLILFGTFAGMSVLNYAFSLAAGWLLTPGDFGLLAFAQTLLTITGLVLNSGFAWSLTAVLVGKVDGGERARLVRGAGLANLGLASVMGLVILLLFGLGPLRRGLETWQTALLVAGILPFFAVVATARAALQGSERFGALSALWLLETGTKTTAGIGLVIAGLGAVGAVSGFLWGSLLAGGVGLGLLKRILAVSPLGPQQAPSFRRAGAMFSALMGMAVLLNLDLLALKLFHPGDRAAVGFYQAGTILANTPYYMMTALFPWFFTQIVQRRELRASVGIVAETFQLALVCMLPVEALLAIFPQAALQLFFPDVYAAGAAVLRLLALGNMAIILAAILSFTFQGTGHAMLAGRTLLGVTLVEAVLLAVAVPIGQGIGAASIFLAATASALVILGGRYLRLLGWHRLVPAFHWLGSYSLAVLLGTFGGGLGWILTRQELPTIVCGGVFYLLGLYRFKVVSLSGWVKVARRQPAEILEER